MTQVAFDVELRLQHPQFVSDLRFYEIASDIIFCVDVRASPEHRTCACHIAPCRVGSAFSFSAVRDFVPVTTNSQ